MPAFNLKQRRIAQIKARAGELINAIIPEHKQRNLTARGLELADKRLDGETLTAEEEAERQSIKEIWVPIKAIRDHSDQLELDVMAGKSVDLDRDWPI